MIYWSLLVITTYRVVQKMDTQIYFWDNFGNSAQILTILSWLQAEIYGANMTFFHRLELLLVVDSLLNSTPKLMWSFFKIVHRGPGDVRWRSILLQCPPVMMTYCSDVRQQTLFEDDIAVVWAVNFRSRIDEDHPCLPHTRYSDWHHDIATEV